MTVKLITLKKRQDFVRAARDRASRKWVTPRVIVQSMPDPTAAAADPQHLRIGFTATKRLGSAIVRNRIRRRLRAAVADVLPSHGKPGFAYVFIGRDQTAACPYQCLLDDLKTALIKLHQQKSGSRGQARHRASGASRSKRPAAR